MGYITRVATICMIYAISNTGLSIFTGFTGQFSLGHAAFFAIGAYAAAIFSSVYSINFYLAILCGAAVSGFVGFIIGWPTLRAKLRSDYFAIATLGFGEAVRVILENLKITNGARGLAGIERHVSFPMVLVFTVLVVILASNFTKSMQGRAAVAVREDFVAAEMMGINVFMVRLRSLVISAFLGGLAGGLFAHYLTFIQPGMFAAFLSTQMIAAVVAGGMGSITGPFLATIIFTAVPEVLRVASMWRLVAYGLLLVLIMIFRPQGIFGYREISITGLARTVYRKFFTKPKELKN